LLKPYLVSVTKAQCESPFNCTVEILFLTHSLYFAESLLATLN